MSVPRIDSYEPNAWRPKLGTRWVWEIDQPHARALVEVAEVTWNGEEWWVRTRTLLPKPNPLEIMPGGFEPTHLNDLSRFWEACTPVIVKLTGRMDQFAERDDSVARAGNDSRARANPEQ